MIRRGVAMILVLGASVLLFSAAAIVARARVSHSLRTDTDARIALAWTVADAAESPIREWLARESGSTVLASNASTPMVEVMDSQFEVAGITVTISVTAWDQCGMVPATEAGLRVATQRLGRRAEHVGWIGHEFPGLDLWQGAGTVFPSRSDPERAGGLVATQNPRQAGRSARGGRTTINLNTAPLWMLDQLLGELGREGLQEVLAGRQRGEYVEFRGVSRDWDGTDIVLTGSSNTWSVRTDVNAGGVNASVWSVFVRRGGIWIREQRLVIAD